MCQLNDYSICECQKLRSCAFAASVYSKMGLPAFGFAATDEPVSDGKSVMVLHTSLNCLMFKHRVIHAIAVLDAKSNSRVKGQTC